MRHVGKKSKRYDKRRGGETFSIIFRKGKKSPFDVPGIPTKATTDDILSAVRKASERLDNRNDETLNVFQDSEEGKELLGDDQAHSQ